MGTSTKHEERQPSNYTVNQDFARREDGDVNQIIPNEPPPSYELSQAQAQAQGPEQAVQNLNLENGPEQRRLAPVGRDVTTDLLNQPNTYAYRVPSTRIPIPDPTQPVPLLLEQALRFAEQPFTAQASSSTAILHRPILVPSTSPPFSFPVLRPSSLQYFPTPLFHTFLTNLNVLLSLSPSSPSNPLVDAYLSRLNTTIFSNCHLHVTLVPTSDLAPILFTEPDHIEASRAISRGEAQVLSGRHAVNLMPWADVIDPASHPSSPSAAPSKSSNTTRELLHLRDRVLADPHAASFLTSAPRPTTPRTFFPHIEHVTSDETHASHSDPSASSQSHSTHPGYDSDTSHTSASSASSSTTSASDAGGGGAGAGAGKGKSRGSGSNKRQEKRARRQERRRAKRARKVARRLERIERRAEKALRRGRKDVEVVRREREVAVERLERRRGARGAGVVREEGERVVWLVIRNEKMRGERLRVESVGGKEGSLLGD